jgi:hypothetical protein
MPKVGRNVPLKGTPKVFPPTIEIGGEIICEGDVLWLSQDLDLRKQVGIILCKGAYILKCIDTSVNEAKVTLELFVTDRERPKQSLPISLLNHFEKMT